MTSEHGHPELLDDASCAIGHPTMDGELRFFEKIRVDGMAPETVQGQAIWLQRRVINAMRKGRAKMSRWFMWEADGWLYCEAFLRPEAS